MRRAATRRLRLALTLLTIVALAGFTVADQSARASATGSEELEFLMRLNDLRVSRSLPPLAWSDAMASQARTWSSSLAKTGILAHDPNWRNETAAAIPDWITAGENVGRGGDAQSIHNAFVASPAHLANMVGDYGRVGIGVVRQAGSIWVTVRFVKAQSGAGTGSNPIGALDGLAWNAPGQLHATGWTLDPDTLSPLSILPVVDGVWRPIVVADKPRPDIGVMAPAYGPNHGYLLDLNGLTTGAHTVCLWGVNVIAGASTQLGCRSATVPVNPFGFLDSAAGGAGSVTTRGWVIDPDTTAPISILITIDGAWQTPLATGSHARPDAAAYYPAYGPNHGYQVTYLATRGSHQVCAWAINVGQGASGLLGCTTATAT